MLRLITISCCTVPLINSLPRTHVGMSYFFHQYHAQAPYKSVGGGESASCVTDRGYYGPKNATSGYVGPSSGVKGGLFQCMQVL